MLKEHVLSTYRKELTVFLAERELKTLEEIGAAADRYEETHARTSTSERKDRSHPEPRRNNGSVPNGNGHNHVGKSGNGLVAGDRPNQNKLVKETGNGHQRPQGPVCYNCNRPDHIAR